MVRFVSATIFTPLSEAVHLCSSGHERLAPHSSPAVLRERKGRAWPKIQQFHCRIQSYGRHNHWYISATPCQDQVVASEISDLMIRTTFQVKMGLSTGRGKSGGTSTVPRSSSSPVATSSSSSTLTASSSPMSPSSTRRHGTSTLPTARMDLNSELAPRNLSSDMVIRW